MAHISAACKRYSCLQCIDDPDCIHSCHEPTTSMFDLDAGKALKEEGMAKVDANADALWKQKASGAITYLIERGGEWTSDQVWELMEQHYPGLTTSNPKVMGALINGAAKTGRIRRVGYRLTERPEAHARPIAVWVRSTP